MKIRITLSMFAIAVLAFTSCKNTPDEPVPDTGQSDPSLAEPTADAIAPTWATAPVTEICPSNFAIVAAVAVDNRGSSSVKGNVAVSPGYTITGFQDPPTNTYIGYGNVIPGPGTVQGTLHVHDSEAAKAHNLAIAAYNGLMAYAPEYTYTGTTQGDGLLLAPGTHKFENLDLKEDGLLFLDFQGNPTAQIIIQVTGTLVTRAGSKVMVVNNNYQDCDGSTVFWAVGSASIDGLGFAGSILANNDISVAPNVIVDGRLWSLNGSVSINTDNVAFCFCQDSSTGGGTGGGDGSGGDGSGGDGSGGDGSGGDGSGGDGSGGDGDGGDGSGGDGSGGDGSGGDGGGGDGGDGSGGGGGGTNPTPTCDNFITGGGWIRRDAKGSGKHNDKATFGVVGGIKNGRTWGSFSYHDHANNVKVKSTRVTSYTQIDEVTRKIEGVARVDGQGSYNYSVIVSDKGEPGRNDTFSLELSNGYKASGKLGGGNIQLHKKCNDNREKGKDKNKSKGKDKDRDKDKDDDDDDDEG